MFLSIVSVGTSHNNVLLVHFRINEVRQDFGVQIMKIDASIAKTQRSRPRGNPSNKWPHTPMSKTDKKFWSWKEARERKLFAEREVLVANRDGFIEMERSRINQLTSMIADVDTVIKILENMFKARPKSQQLSKDELT